MLLLVLMFLLGLAVGSFLNVLIDRIPAGESVVIGRSYCDNCKHKLSWYDLIPLLSWVALVGKCRYCGKGISWQYPAVELAGGLFFAFGYFFASGYIIRDGVVLSNTSSNILSTAVFSWVILSILLVIFVIDLKYYIIPDSLLLAGGVFVLAYRYLLTDYHAIFFNNYPLASSIGAGGFFLALVLITRGKGMGLGDVKYGLFMGLLLGFPGVVVGLYSAFLTGAFISVILVIYGRKKFGQVIPFGPFLVIGTAAAFFGEDKLLELFWRLF